MMMTTATTSVNNSRAVDALRASTSYPSPQLIEQIAQKQATYMNIMFEDAARLSQDPVGRQRAMDAQSRRPNALTAVV